MQELLLIIAVLGQWGCSSTPAGPGDLSAAAPGDTIPDSPPPAASSQVRECDTPEASWIWCDDFENDRLEAYFEHNDAGGDFVRHAGVGVEASVGMRTVYREGKAGVGWMHVAFGRTPQARMHPVDEGAANHREVYWRFLVRNQAGWTGGGGAKLTRARGFASPDEWQQSFEGPLWAGNKDDTRDILVLDPVSGTDEEGNLLPPADGSLGAGARWLGVGRGQTRLFADENVGPWYCVEVHLRLNDPGLSNGVFEFWIDDQLEARREGLNWVGGYTEYGINTISLDNYWNGGAPKQQERYLDNFVVSTGRIGCD